MKNLMKRLDGIHDGQAALFLAVIGMQVRDSTMRYYPDVDQSVAYFVKGKPITYSVEDKDYTEKMCYPSDWADAEAAADLLEEMEKQEPRQDSMQQLTFL